MKSILRHDFQNLITSHPPSQTTGFSNKRQKTAKIDQKVIKKNQYKK